MEQTENDPITVGVQKVRSLDKFTDHGISELIFMAEHEPNDVVRACARATIEGNAISILKHYILEKYTK